MRLVETDDGYFAWMLDPEPAGALLGLRQPPGGVFDPAIIEQLWELSAQLRIHRCLGSWMMVDGFEVVGLCGYKSVPSQTGDVEIAYGVSAARRGRGLATLGVAALIACARRDTSVQRLTAETVADNFASRRVLEKNGFTPAETFQDEEQGEFTVWARAIP